MEYIDMHSHILPGLDDGSKNMEMTLAMLRVAVEEGIGTIYTTPHCMPGKGHPTLAKVEERIRLVQRSYQDTSGRIEGLPFPSDMVSSEFPWTEP